MKVSYKRELDHNYLVLEEEEYQENYQAGMLLKNKMCIRDRPGDGNFGKVILLSEAEYREDETYPAVCRYQSCSQVLRQALAIYAEQTPKVLGVALRTETVSYTHLSQVSRLEAESSSRGKSDRASRAFSRAEAERSFSSLE